MAESAAPTLLGIRHHGPGSARSVLAALTALQPDLILVEGPPDAQDLLPLVIDPDLRPPVALLLYDPGEPRHAVYYPFASFSPEWQAIRYGLQQGVPVRFMDLPQAVRLALEINAATAAVPEAAADGADEVETVQPIAEPPDAAPPPAGPQGPELRRDPLRWVAEAAGYGDGERWWEHQVELRQDSSELFQAIGELMGALRAAADAEQPP